MTELTINSIRKKQQKNYYLPEDLVNHIKTEAKRMTRKYGTNVSENVVLTEILDQHFNPNKEEANREKT